MSNLTTVVNNIISKVNTHTTDLSNKATQISTHIPLSGITAYHLLQGNLAVSASTTTQGFNTTLYTGNGSTQSINTGIDMNTQWGNDASEKFGGLVWIKNRGGENHHLLSDTVRGANNYLYSSSNIAQFTYAGTETFTSTGFSITGIGSEFNANSTNYASWNFQTTHRVTGTTNHGQAYECHYNPFTGFTMVKYTGSGLAGHEIPHMLGRKLGFVTTKNLGTVSEWVSQYKENTYLYLNQTIAETTTSINITNFGDSTCTFGNGANNTASNSYIMYGWANSYLDKSNKLIGNYEIGVYQGTGVAGNKITTRGKPAWIMIKRLDSTGPWIIFDNQRKPDYYAWLLANSTQHEYADRPIFNSLDSNGFTLGSAVDTNASGGQYLYMVAYDTNSNGGGSYYPLASDTANVQVNNALIPIAQGIDSNGAKNTILSKNETFSGVTYTQGKNYPYYDALGNRGVSNKAPNYGLTNPANGGDFYNVLSNKWFTSAGTEITNGRNYLNHIVYADNDGGVLYVEELPKIEYRDIVNVNNIKINSGFDLGQTWQNVTASRVAGITYINSTGKPIMVSVAVADYRGYGYAAGMNAYVDSNITSRVLLASSLPDYGGLSTVSFIVPNGSSYKVVTWEYGYDIIDTWTELR